MSLRHLFLSSPTMPIYPTTDVPLSPSTTVTSAQLPSLATPSYPSGGNFTVQAITHLPNVSPATALLLIRDTSSWSRWNSFCPSATIISPATAAATGTPSGPTSPDAALVSHPSHLSVGMEVSMSVHMSGDGLTPGTKGEARGISVTVLEAITPSCPPLFTPSTSSTSSPSSTPSSSPKRGYRIAWKTTGWAKWNLWTERVMEFTEDGSGSGTDYVCWETFGGVMAGLVRRNVGAQLVDRFGDYMRDVRADLCQD